MTWFLIAVRYEVNKLESSVAVQEFEFAINRVLYGVLWSLGNQRVRLHLVFSFYYSLAQSSNLYYIPNFRMFQFLGKQQMLFGKTTEVIWGHNFCKKCNRGLIPKSLSVLSMEPLLRDEDPRLNGKCNFCNCLSTELIQLSISSCFCTYVYWSGPSTAQVGKLALHPWHARA